ITALGYLPGHSYSSALAVSGDGKVAVGYSRPDNNHDPSLAVRWTNNSPLPLGTFPGASNSTAFAINADGSVIVGQSGGEAFWWTADGGMKPVKELIEKAGFDYPRWHFSRATGVSSDGSVIVGTGSYDKSGD